MMEWQPIETAPRDGTEFLAFWSNAYGKFKFIQPMMWLNNRFVVTWDHDDDVKPTHWMPLPQPPEDTA